MLGQDHNNMPRDLPIHPTLLPAPARALLYMPELWQDHHCDRMVETGLLTNPHTGTGIFPELSEVS